MKIGQVLAKLRKEKGYNQPKVAEYLTACGYNTTQQAISKWERNINTPNAEQFLLLCRLYDIRDVLSVFLKLPNTLASLNSQGQKRVDEYIRLLSLDEEFAMKKTGHTIGLFRTIPLYDLPVSAGTGQFLDSSNYELIEVDETVPISATYAVKISGDSMLPLFVDQQIIYIKQQQLLESGEIGIFILNGDAYCKQLEVNNNTILVSLNDKYDSIIIKECDDFRILGKVVG